MTQRPTFFDLLHRFDQIINKILQIIQRIRDARRSIHLRKGRIKDRYNILQQIRRESLTSRDQFQCTIPILTSGEGIPRK
jgi:hypothetical protein